ncbi:MAG: vesicle coat component [Phylliscum demangeonii]|nr:MAG: vesicle coat component [Phylliscum demangeonii]
MLISSTLHQDLWKRVTQEFVRQEVRKLGGKNKPLAALYDVFGRNYEESIDELVPPSARAGYQLVSKSAETASINDNLAGLEMWAETLSLVVSNRTPDDGQALAALGTLLLSYGRVAAAHICYMFARPFSSFGGHDDPQASISLVGIDHRRPPFDAGGNLEPVLLSEMYEFGLSLAAPSQVFSAGHLQVYKLHHAMVLAEHGHRHEAQQYCEAMASQIKSSTKPAGYHAGLLMSSLEELSRRLQQSPSKDGASSWISKPSMEKMSGSLFAKLNSFIEGSESDQAAKSDADLSTADVGPFARLAGNTPNASRPSSRNGPYPNGIPGPAYASVAGRAGSGGPTRYSPYTSSDSYLPHTASSLQRSYTEPTTEFDGYVPSPSLPAVNMPNEGHLNHQAGAYGAADGYFGLQGLASDGGSIATPATSSHPLQGTSGYEATGAGYQPPSYPPSSRPTVEHHDSSASGLQPASSYEPPTSGYSSYEPPSSSGYDPPPEDGETTSGTGRRQKSYMDDDDDDDRDLLDRAGALARKEKMQKDKEAEANFQRAAEADAKREQESGEKKGWFGGWFGGKKDQLPAAAGPIKAKLGDESSFYYDTEAKKWVNKKTGTGQAPSSSTPPPPKGPPSRSVSRGPTATPPITASGSAPTTTSKQATLAGAARSVSAANGTMPPPPLLSRQTSILPPRSTSASASASAFDPSTSAADPAGREGSHLPPPSRPGTSMSNASSIDDLLGPPGAAAASRKAGAGAGGTLKKSKRGRGYVDVMAK